MKTVSIFVLIDALGWDYIKNRSFLDDICPVKRPVKSILGFSSGVIPSILTGAYPPEHKHWFLYFYSPKQNCFLWTAFFDWLPADWLNSRYTRKIVEEISKRLMGYNGYFETYLIPVERLHLYDISENKRIYAPKGMRHGKNIFDILEERDVDYKCYAYPMKDQDIFFQAQKDILSAGSSFYFLYFSESDAYLHRGCKDQEGTRKMIDVYEQEIRTLYREASRKHDRVDLYVFSDHSMSPVYESHDLKSEIEALGYKIPKDYVPFYDSTMARFWFFNFQAHDAVVKLLKQKPYGRLLSLKEKKERHVHFEDDLYGEELFLMNNGTVINPSYMGNRPPEGMHGYDVMDGAMDAVLVSTRQPDVEVADVKDFFKIMEKYAR
ncbi:MAG TPA: alkaline phosphatase family protein [Candidatus Omnitrophota bacterium]|nr:alkaline phosphatase family protein [Candidatus Omnitrophota bacterium]HPN56007.1 alkaline phosphatase family protein [Candidatus Omnitrophota bacterium]